MEQYIEFASNHPLMVFGTIGLIAFLIYYESDQLLSGIKGMNPPDLTRALNDGDAVLVDVRDGKSFKAGHISGAIHIPSAEVVKRLSELKRHEGKTIAFCCNVGMTARSAAKAAKKAGLQNVAVLTGGLEAWNKANLPVVSR
ncbi:MAG: rhodanese-like domain-containing protein [Gammaproteobacteria bacterium]|nr:rhodanese-like domain-containing protein [Gammaproteobacteria bacterium]